MAYTSAKSGFDIEWCKQCDAGLPKPDIVCFMDTKQGSVTDRQDFGEERYETTEFQKLVYSNFSQLFDLNQSTGECLVLNAKDTIDSLHNEILGHVTGYIESKKCTHNDMKTLW